MTILVGTFLVIEMIAIRTKTTTMDSMKAAGADSVADETGMIDMTEMIGIGTIGTIGMIAMIASPAVHVAKGLTRYGEIAAFAHAITKHAARTRD